MRFRLSRLLPPTLALFFAGCSLFKGSPDGESGDGGDLPSRPEAPARVATGDSTLKEGKFPVIRFESDNWKLPAPEQAKVIVAAKWLKGNAERVLVSSGAQSLSQEYSRQVSDLRAHTVKEVLISGGVAATRILTVSYGEDAPASIGDGVTLTLLSAEG